MKRRVLVPLLWSLGLFASVCYYIPIFRLQRVEVKGETGATVEAITHLLDAQPGANLLRIDLSQWASRIAALPAIESARTRITLTGKAVAHVKAAQSVALVDTHPVAGVSVTGTLLPLSDHPPERSLPLITGIGGTPEYYSETRRPGILTALAFLQQWQEQAESRARRLVEIQVQPSQEICVYLWPERLWVNLGRGSWDVRTETLWSVLKRLPVADEQLDLRFKGQVIGPL